MANKKVAKAGKAADNVRANPYVQRLVEDEDLRKNIVQAYESARDAYGRLSNGKSPAKQIFDDKKLQKHVKDAAGNIRDVSVSLREAPKKQSKKRGGLGRVLLLGIVGTGVALRGQRGPAQEGAGHALRRRGGVRVHLDDLRSGDGRHAGVVPPRQHRMRAPTGRPRSLTGRLLGSGNGPPRQH